MLLFLSTVYWNSRHYERPTSSATRPAHSQLGSLETHDPEKMIARPWPTVDLPAVLELHCLQSQHKKSTQKMLYGLPRSVSNSFTLMLEPDSGFSGSSFLSSTGKKMSQTPTHFQRQHSLLEMGNDFYAFQTARYECQEFRPFSVALSAKRKHIKPCLLTPLELPLLICDLCALLWKWCHHHWEGKLKEYATFAEHCSGRSYC